MKIPKTMMAIVKTKRERGAEYMEVPVPEIGAGEALIKVHATAICGTDIHAYTWNEWAQNNFERSFSPLPRIMGHEFSGEVVLLGEGVTNVKIGQKVCCETHIPCGNCYQCRTGNPHNCLHVKRFKDGIYGEYCLVPASMLVALPDDTDYDLGTIMEPFSVATHACSKVRVVGDTVLVLGAGPIGLFVVAIAKAMGASYIYVSDVSEYRRGLALKAGATEVLDPLSCDLVTEIKVRTDGLGCGTVFDTSGNVGAIKQGFEALRKCGDIVLVGLPSKPLVLDAANDIVWKEAHVHGIHGKEEFISWEISKGLLLSGRMDVNDLITHRFKMSEFQEAFELAAAGKTGKIILYPDSIINEKEQEE